MKKYFYFAALALAAASCTQTEVVDVPQSSAIGFQTFVGKPSRADVTTANLTSFLAYGGFDSDLFAGTTVSTADGGTNWTYEPLRYWEEGETYYFGAVAPSDTEADAEFTVTTNTLAITDYEVSDEDLVVAISNENGYQGKGTGNDKVSFNFVHALAKVQFTFTSEWDANTTVELTDVSINAVNKGTAAVTYESAATKVAWTPGSETGYEYDSNTFSEPGDFSTVLYVLPQTVDGSTIKLTFTVSTDIQPTDGEETVEVAIPAITWENGKAYNYELTINAKNVFDIEPIEFSNITVSEWTDGTVSNPDLTKDDYTQD